MHVPGRRSGRPVVDVSRRGWVRRVIRMRRRRRRRPWVRMRMSGRRARMRVEVRSGRCRVRVLMPVREARRRRLRLRGRRCRRLRRLGRRGGQGAGSGSGATAPAIVLPDCFGAGVDADGARGRPGSRSPTRRRGRSPAAAGVTEVCGAVGVVGAAERRCAGAVRRGRHHDLLRRRRSGVRAGARRIGGRCAVPESRISAVAPAPISSGISSAAARRAAAPSASHFPRSLADTASSSHFPDGPPRPWSRDTRNPIGRQAGNQADVRCFRWNHCPCEPRANPLLADDRPGVHRVPRRGVGAAGARRARPLRAFVPRGVPVGPRLDHGSAQARGVPPRRSPASIPSASRGSASATSSGCSATRGSSATAARSRPRSRTPARRSPCARRRRRSRS